MAKKVKKAAKSKPKAKPKAKVKPKAKAKPKAVKKPAPQKSSGSGLPKDVEKRLTALAKQMDKTFAAVVLQACCEFADAWEDHFRTVDAMVEEDERIQIVVKPE